MGIKKNWLNRPKECFKILKDCLIYFYPEEIEGFYISKYYHKPKTGLRDKLLISISKAFKENEYEDFKEFLNVKGIKDIREAYISFKRSHSGTRTKSKLDKKSIELRNNILEWTGEWEELKNYTIDKTEEERSKFIDDRIRFLGYEEVNNLFEEEKNKEKPHAFNFLIYILAGKENYEDIDWDNY
ncbi:hypothetical protein ES708_30684 [subsurface metagenome]